MHLTFHNLRVPLSLQPDLQAHSGQKAWLRPLALPLKEEMGDQAKT